MINIRDDIKCYLSKDGDGVTFTFIGSDDSIHGLMEVLEFQTAFNGEYYLKCWGSNTFFRSYHMDYYFSNDFERLLIVGVDEL